MVQVMRGGRGINRALDSSQELIFTPGNDLYRYTNHLRVIPVIDGSYSSEMTGLAISEAFLRQLVGEETAEGLLSRLGLTSLPDALVRPTPLHVSNHLTRALHGARNTTGKVLTLFCQARALDCRFFAWRLGLPTHPVHAGHTSPSHP